MHLYNFLMFDFPPSMPLLKRKKKLILQAIRNWQFHPSMPKQTNMSKKVKIMYSKLSSPLPSCVVVHDFQTKTFTKTRKTKSSSKLKRISFRRISPQLRKIFQGHILTTRLLKNSFFNVLHSTHDESRSLNLCSLPAD
jgi:hypothetical protein